MEADLAMGLWEMAIEVKSLDHVAKGCCSLFLGPQGRNLHNKLQQDVIPVWCGRTEGALFSQSRGSNGAASTFSSLRFIIFVAAAGPAFRGQVEKLGSPLRSSSRKKGVVEDEEKEERAEEKLNREGEAMVVGGAWWRRFMQNLGKFSDVFSLVDIEGDVRKKMHRKDFGIAFQPTLRTKEERTAALSHVVKTLHFNGHLPKPHGVPEGQTCKENVIKECREEAGFGRAIAERATPVSILSYEQIEGCKFERYVLFCFDLQLPRNFTPQCTDGEVESFRLLSIPCIKSVLETSTQFKPSCAIVTMDFLIRHGMIKPEQKGCLTLL
ncbi:Nudix hydrolase 20 [Nymphaea thermarum]|nr:Nudix hydrolase 20 [Nymphaea thermarum]